MSGLLTDDGWPAAHVVWSIELDVLRCTNCGAQRAVTDCLPWTDPDCASWARSHRPCLPSVLL